MQNTEKKIIKNKQTERKTDKWEGVLERKGEVGGGMGGAVLFDQQKVGGGRRLKIPWCW